MYRVVSRHALPLSVHGQASPREAECFVDDGVTVFVLSQGLIPVCAWHGASTPLDVVLRLPLAALPAATAAAAQALTPASLPLLKA